MTAGMTLAMLAGAYDLGLRYVLPWWLLRSVDTWNLNHPGWQLTLSSLSVSPWQGSVTLEGLALTERHHLPGLRVGAMELSLSSSSLWQRALIIQEISIQRPCIRVHLDEHGHLNLENLLPTSKSTSDKPTPGIRWLIRNLQVASMHVHIVDDQLHGEKPLDLDIPSWQVQDVGSWHGRAEAQLDMKGALGGARAWRLRWWGSLNLAPLRSTGHVMLTHGDLAALGVPLSQLRPVRIDRGTLEFSTDYSFDDHQGHRQWTLDHTRLQVQGLRLQRLGFSSPKLELAAGDVQIAHVDSEQHQLEIQRVKLDRPELFMQRDVHGKIDLLTWITELAPPSSSPQSVPWQIKADQVRLSQGSLTLHAWEAGQDKAFSLQGIQVDLDNLDTSGQRPWTLQANMQGLLLGQVHLEGKVQADQADIHWQIQRLHLSHADLWLPKDLGADVHDGILSASGKVLLNLHHQETYHFSGQAAIEQLNMDIQHQHIQVAALQLGPWDYQRARMALQGLNVQSLSLGDQGGDKLSLGDVRVGAVHSLEQGARWALDSFTLHKLGVYSSSGPVPLQGQLKDLTLQGVRVDPQHASILWQQSSLGGGAIDLRQGKHHNRLSFHQAELDSGSWQASPQQLDIMGLHARQWRWEGRHPWLDLNRLEGQGIHVNLAQHKLITGTLDLQFSQLRLDQNRDGTWVPYREIQYWLKQLPTATTAQPKVSVPWSYDGQGLHLGMDRLRYAKVGTALPWVASQLTLKTGPWHTLHPLAVQFSGQWGQARLAWEGTLHPLTRQAQGQLSVQDLDLAPVQPWLAQYTHALLDHGTISSRGKVEVNLKPLQFIYHGNIAIGDLLLNDDLDHQPLLSWKQVSLPLVDLGYPRPGLRIPEVDVDHLYSKVAIEPKGQLNWQRILRPRHPAAPSASQHPLIVDVNRVVLNQASVDFSDLSLRLPFHASIHHLNGEAGPLNMQHRSAWTKFLLQGVVDRHGHVDMSGKLQPFADQAGVEVALHFRDIEMPTLNPYAAQFAGYRIDQGMMDLELDYRLTQQHLVGTNHLRMDQLELGPQVSGGAAIDLPLHLAVDVLRNSDGRIDLNVPVYGNLNDPDLDIRSVIFKALEGTLRHVLDSPLEFVSELWGEHADSIKHIEFMPGSSLISAQESHKLAALVQVLQQHRHMLVFIHASYSQDTDPQALVSAAASGSLLTISHDALRSLALHRAEAIKSLLIHAGIADHKIFIDEPQPVQVTSGAMIPTTLDVKLR